MSTANNCVICNHSEVLTKDTPICNECLNNLIGIFHHFQKLAEKVNLPINENSIAKGKNEDGIPLLPPNSTFSLSPLELYNKLAITVKGQENALKSISSAICLHNFLCEKLNTQVQNENISYEKLNLLLYGPTGVGKTYTISQLAKLLNKPYCIASCSMLTSPGFIGSNIETCYWNLYINAGKNKKNAEQGILYLDEIDKLSVLKSTNSLTGGNHGQGVQQGLLSLLEGGTVRANASGSGISILEETIDLDTTNILVIGSGAFSGLENIINQRIKKMGKRTTFSDYQATNDDLIKYGFLPEFASRFRYKIKFANHSYASLIEILNSSDGMSPFAIYESYFQERGIKLEIDEKAKDRIARICLQSGSGARPLIGIIHSSIEKYIFEPPVKQVVITEKDI